MSREGDDDAVERPESHLGAQSEPDVMAAGVLIAGRSYSRKVKVMEVYDGGESRVGSFPSAPLAIRQKTGDDARLSDV